MKKTIKYTLLSLLVLVSFSCNNDEFLDLRPLDFVSPESFTTPDQIAAAVNGTYRALTMADGLYEANTWPIYLDFIVDNGFMDKTWSGEVDFWDQSQGPSSLYAARKWERNYRGILRANTVLKFIDQVDIVEDLRTQYKGEARFLRALFYSDLIEFYGDVPLRLEPEGIDQKDKERTPKAEILEFILSELDQAAQELPDVYTSASDLGRATQGAALGIKARNLLWNKRWQECADVCQEVIDLGVYEIYGNYPDLFTLLGEGTNQEVMFDIQQVAEFSDDRLGSPWATYFQLWQSYMATYDLAKEFHMTNGLPIDDPLSGFAPQDPFANRDPRLEFTVTAPFTFRNTSISSGNPVTYDPCSEGSNNFTGLKIKKYIDREDDVPNNKSSGANNVVIRYADILLMRAEALVESGAWTSNPEEVMDLVNQVRQREGVDMPRVQDAEGANLGEEELRQIIRHERRVEFAFEGTRYNDIKRWDIGEEALSDGHGYRPNLLDHRPTALVMLTACTFQAIQQDASEIGFTQAELDGQRENLLQTRS
ncbi:MAG: RagB/SusD family nutrient uptake outer membrane protein [Bacteroidota bacterium]